MSKSDQPRHTQNQRGLDKWSKSFIKKDRRRDRQLARLALLKGEQPHEVKHRRWVRWL